MFLELNKTKNANELEPWKASRHEKYSAPLNVCEARSRIPETHSSRLKMSEIISSRFPFFRGDHIVPNMDEAFPKKKSAEPVRASVSDSPVFRLLTSEITIVGTIKNS